MKNNISAFLVGVIFSIGLGISGMTHPEKVIAFLDVFGHWDASLAFVMAGAIAVHAVAYRLIRRRSSPLFSNEFLIPTNKDLTPALLIGAFIFGIGWALAGYCPGPAITSLASLNSRPFIFVISLIVGMFIFRIYQAVLNGKK